MVDDLKVTELIIKPALQSIFEAGKKSGQFFTLGLTFSVTSLIVLLGLQSQLVQSELVNFSIANIKIYFADSCWLFIFGSIGLMYKSSSLRLVESTLYSKLLSHPMVDNSAAKIVYATRSFYFYPTISNLFNILKNENFKLMERDTEGLHQENIDDSIIMRSLSIYGRLFKRIGRLTTRLYSGGVQAFVIVLNYIISNILRVGVTVIQLFIVMSLQDLNAKSIIGEYEFTAEICFIAVILIYIIELNVFFINNKISLNISRNESDERKEYYGTESK